MISEISKINYYILYVFVILSQIHPSWCQTENNCSDTMFACKNSLTEVKCIEQWQTCNGKADCPDASDETLELCKQNECAPYEFQCSYGGCVLIYSVCNYINDCVDGSDESNCPLFRANNTCSGKLMVSCLSGDECIRIDQKCDGETNCRDNSDEILTLCEFQTCTEDEFRCGYRACIRKELVCDGKPDCADYSDEKNCSNPANRVTNIDICGPDKFECKVGHCIDNNQVCNGVRDCYDGSDETYRQCNQVPCDLTSHERCYYGGCALRTENYSKKHCAYSFQTFTLNNKWLTWSSAEVDEDAIHFPNQPIGSTPLPICIYPPIPEHGSYTSKLEYIPLPGEKTQNGNQLKFFCFKGYTLVGKSELTCVRGKWNSIPPKCNILQIRKSPSECIYPEFPENGDYKLTNEGFMPFPNADNGTILQYICSDGYDLMGTREIQCLSGKWNANPPKCIKRTLNEITGLQSFCAYPPFPRSGYYKLRNGHIPLGDIAENGTELKYLCYAGYTFVGKSILTCMNGKWNFDPPKCLKPRTREHPIGLKVCPPLQTTYVHSVSCSDTSNQFLPCDNAVDGMIAHVQCARTFELENYAYAPFNGIKCESGSWNHKLYGCIAECGTIYNIAADIINGSVVVRSNYPWIVSIYERLPKGEYIQRCAGSIIADRLILSAAHCFWNYDLSQRDNDLDKYVIAIGKSNRAWNVTINKEDIQYRKVSRIMVPQKFRAEQSSFANDIALIVLNASIEFSSDIRPVCLDWENNLDLLIPNRLGNVAGWGLTAEFGDPSEELRDTKLPFVDYETCFNESPVEFRPFITFDKFCAGFNNGTNVCTGDSGGGFTFKKNNRHFLQGIVSIGVAKGATCDARKYITFTNIRAHMKWLKTLTQQYL